MTKMRWTAALVLIFIALVGGATGCGSDASVGAFPGPTSTPAGGLRVSTPVPTATALPASP
jgi:hypothetical protein